MPPPCAPKELAGKPCAWLTADNIFVTGYEGLKNPNELMHSGFIRVFFCVQFDSKGRMIQTTNPDAPGVTWLGCCHPEFFMYTPEILGMDEDEEDITVFIKGKPVYQATWQTEARCVSTTDREIIKPTGVVIGHVHAFAGGNTLFLKITDEFVNSEGFSGGKWSTVY